MIIKESEGMKNSIVQCVLWCLMIGSLWFFYEAPPFTDTQTIAQDTVIAYLAPNEEAVYLIEPLVNIEGVAVLVVKVEDCGGQMANNVLP